MAISKKEEKNTCKFLVMSDTQVRVALVLTAQDRMSRLIDNTMMKSMRSLKRFTDAGAKIKNIGSVILRYGVTANYHEPKKTTAQCIKS